jgi:glycosyltransferase involved in cell wall biosynthesis
VPYEILALEAVIREAEDFDVIHFHEACLHLPWTRRVQCATVTTMHGRLDLRDLEPLYREYADVPLVSISDAQREPMAWANWRATVYHGLPDDLYRFHPEPGGYLAFLGRICPEKRVDRALAIAKRAGIELKIAAKVDAADEEYFETEIRHLLDDPAVDFIGEIGDGEKEAFLGGAAALLMPIGWPEPFGLVVIEAMACGTPVIAFPFGSMPELIEPGVNGVLVESVDQAVAAVETLAALDRTLCRRSFEERFTTARMAKDYVRVYATLVEEGVRSPRRAALSAAGMPSAIPGWVAAEERQPAAWVDQTGVEESRPQ